jgi:hypothetical protein
MQTNEICKIINNTFGKYVYTTGMHVLILVCKVFKLRMNNICILPSETFVLIVHAGTIYHAIEIIRKTQISLK